MADSKDDESDDGLSGVADFVQIYLISVDIVGATNIEKADTFGKSDPFCKVSAFSTSYTTCTIKKTLNPTWNEHVEMTFFNDPKRLKFELFDYDGNTKDDPIGDCFLNLDATIYDADNKGFDGNIKLMNCKSGELRVKVVARKLVPSELEQRLDSLQDLAKKNANDIEELNANITDWNNKNNALQTENDKINTNITNLTADIPNHEKELKEKEEQGERLKEEEDGEQQEIDGLEQKLNDLKKSETEIDQKLADIQQAEDKKKTENEHLRKDIENLKKQIAERKAELQQREEQQKREREERDRKEQEAEQQALKAKEKQKEEAKVTPSGSSDVDDTQPLVNSANKNVDDQSGGDGCCNCIIL